MDNFITVLSVIFTFFSGVLIIAFNKNKKVHKVILGSILLIFSGYEFIYIDALNSWIINFPLHIERSLYLAIPPLSYLYIKYALYEKPKLSKSDYLHFIPVLIIFVNVLYGSEMSSGFISGAVLSTVKACQAIVYTILTWHLLYKSYNKPLLNNLKSLKRRWLFVFSIFISVIHILVAYSACQILFLEELDKLDPLFMVRLLLLIMVMVMFFHPSIIYSITEPKQPDLDTSGNIESSVVGLIVEPNIQLFSDEKLKVYLQQIEELNKDVRFFKSIFTIVECAEYLKIPTRHLTYILNHHFMMRFNDFINGYRIRYIIVQFQTGFLKELTMEAIALEAGFSSRTTFFTAFKKYTGKNPSQYLKDENFPIPENDF